MPSIIGIDLGTTNSLCAVFQEGQPQLVPNVHGKLLTPSIVGVLRDGQVVVGAAAQELRVTHPERCAWCFKRWMGTDQKTELADHVFSAPELSSLVLKSLKEDAIRHLNEDITDAVITVPAYFNDNQRKATKLAGELAGLNVRRILNEPTAAALTYGFHERDAEKHLIVIDLGGGTFDVTAMEIFEGTLDIISTAGETQLGGEDFTDRLVAWVLQGQGQQLETAELKVPLLVARLRQECELAKRTLFKDLTATIRVPNEDGLLSDDCQKLELTRPVFAELIDGLVKRLARPMARAVRDARLEPSSFSDVILVGGATRMLAVRDYVEEFFNSPPHCKFNPDEVVALGAAVQAALIEDNVDVEDMVMTDVCPFTLGVEVSKEFGTRRSAGYFLPIIHRNTTIPVSREEVVGTVDPNQREVALEIYQGEARKVKDNLKLGSMVVDGIPPGPSGQEIVIRFTYDLNGILEVEAIVPSTGKRFRTVLTQNVKGLTPDKIKEAVERMQKIKFYPRDDLKNQHLARFAERVIGEVSPYQRDELDEALDQFEKSMHSQDREAFNFARVGLLSVLSALGYTFDEPDEQHS